MKQPRLAAIILTKNEERDLPGCLASLEDCVDEVYVIDSGSYDATREIAEQAGAIVLERSFDTYARQFNWAIDSVPTDADWLLRIDADERVTPELAQSLRALMRTAPESCTGVSVARRTIFMGRRLRFGGTFPVWLLRVWRRGAGKCEDRAMDEHIVLQGGEVVYASGELDHVIPKSLAEWSRKHVWYAERECIDARAECDGGPALEGQAGRIRGMKTSLYYRMPPYLRVVAYWAYRYFGQLGFLDGRAGLVYHFLQGAWYRALVDALLDEEDLRRRSATSGLAERKVAAE